ncbi:hypothetical protein GCM10009802_05410 [Streptomyces synnematoformans]|uniref:Transposase n=1 Tax=Streptomyces synnematoformans TaxID=415721 RepID=A0ABN2XFF9_9ACTN
MVLVAKQMSRCDADRPKGGVTVPAHRDCQREVQEDLPGIMDGPRLPPGRQRRGYRLVQARLADRLRQRNRTGLRDHLPTVSLDTDTRARRDKLAHLESALSLAANRTLSKSYRCRSRALSAFLINSWTIHFVKTRG